MTRHEAIAMIRAYYAAGTVTVLPDATDEALAALAEALVEHGDSALVADIRVVSAAAAGVIEIA